MVKFKEITWEANEPITVDLMNFMVFNDIFVRDEFIECKLNNVNPDSGETREKMWVVNHAALFARELSITPGADLKYDSDGFPYFTKTYSFPGNNFWDSNYKPVAVLTSRGNRGLPLSVILTSVKPNQITYTVYINKKMNISPSRQFYIDILAIGVKPVADNDLDNDVDPTP
jgi:hypothetical protein